jgi:6-pyruvoyltetrahydropterin/6-carboxytetrahydropterin synthase
MDPGAPAVRLQRHYRFSAAHFYYDPELSQAENERLFGKGANRHGHGHNYRVRVTVAGEPGPRTGMIVDLAALDRLVRAQVIDQLDHRHLNHEVPFFATQQPTCENLARFVWEALRDRLPAGRLDSVEVHEDEDLAADCRGGP